METRSVKIPIAIIGGGLSGLFASESLFKQQASFKLIESSEKAIGGLASLGGMKIGLLPAGLSTAKYVGKEPYCLLTEDFRRRYKNYFFEEVPKEHLTPNEYFTPKVYQSMVIEHTNVTALVNSIKDKIKKQIVVGEVCSIKRDGSQYKLELNSGISISCSKLIVASGRRKHTHNLIEKLGQDYHGKNQIMLGCRASFNPTKSAIKLFNNQPDFKIKAQTGFQNYCFNYKGYLHVLTYRRKKYFSGSLNFKSEFGNTFIGKKIIVNDFDFLNFCPFAKNIGTNELRSLPINMKEEQLYKRHLLEFIEQFSLNYDINFTGFFFPAFEQFWPAPKLKKNSFESLNLRNVFFIGDSSGISFGALQCFITANILIDQMSSENGIH